MKLSTPKESYLWLRALWEHHRNSRMTRAALEAEQARKFRKLVAFVAERSPYYRRIIREQGIDLAKARPEDFPVLTKGEVAAHFDEMVTDPAITKAGISAFLERSADPEELYLGRYHVLHTSGTSGTIGHFVYSRRAWIRGVSHVVRASSLRLGQRVAYVAAARGHFAGVSLIMAGNDGTNRLFYHVQPYDVGMPLPQIIAGLNRQQPHALIGYAAALRVLAEAQERGELRIRPRHIGNGGEPLSPEVKACLERVFGVPVMNAYASSEHLYMGLTLPGYDGMHLLEDDLIFELHADHTCVTNLFNEVLPLIRYRMDDVLVPEESGASPYPFTRVRELVGRQEQALVFQNADGEEDFIHPIVIVELVVPGLHAWQVVLESKVAFRLRAQYQRGLTAEQRAETTRLLRARLQALLDEKSMTTVQFEIEPVDALERDPRSGKFRMVITEPEAAEPARMDCTPVFS